MEQGLPDTEAILNNDIAVSKKKRLWLKIGACLMDHNDIFTLIFSTAVISFLFPTIMNEQAVSTVKATIIFSVLFGFIFRLHNVLGTAKERTFMTGLADETARLLLVFIGVLTCVALTTGLQHLPWYIWPIWMIDALTMKTILYGLKKHYQEVIREYSPSRKNVLIVCASAQGIMLAGRIMQENSTVKVLGFADDRKDRVNPDALPLPYLGTVREVAQSELGKQIDQVVIALPGMAKERIEQVLDRVAVIPADILMSPDIAVLNRPKGLMNAQGPLNLLPLDASPVVGWRAFVKRLEDIIGALVAILIFSPAFILLPILIKLESPGPIFYRQKRYGFNNKLFDCYKFRSMRQDACVASTKEIKLTERDDPRVTKIGNFIRSTSLDEIPQFLNVLKGDMSLVGPRPHPPGVKAGGRIYEDVIYDFARRYKVKPGLTGWAQVNGARGNTFTEEDLRRRFTYDLDYIQNWSLWLDLVIIIRTAFQGFTGKNAF